MSSPRRNLVLEGLISSRVQPSCDMPSAICSSWLLDVFRSSATRLSALIATPSSLRRSGDLGLACIVATSGAGGILLSAKSKGLSRTWVKSLSGLGANKASGFSGKSRLVSSLSASMRMVAGSCRSTSATTISATKPHSPNRAAVVRLPGNGRKSNGEHQEVRSDKQSDLYLRPSWEWRCWSKWKIWDQCKVAE